MDICSIAKQLAVLRSGKIRRGYGFPFGGWLEIQHRYLGKVGLAFLRSDGKTVALPTKALPKFNSGWCSAVEGFTIIRFQTTAREIFIELISGDRVRRIVFFANFANFVITDVSGRIIWVYKRTSRLSVGLDLPIPDDVIEIEPNTRDSEDIIQILDEGLKEFEKTKDDYISSYIRKALGKEISRTQRAIVAVHKDSEKLGEPDSTRKRADAIMANLSIIIPKSKSAKISDPYTGEMIEIELDPLIPAARFAEKLYSKARKAERGKAEIIKRLAELSGKLKRMEEVSQNNDVFAIADFLNIDTDSLLGTPASEMARPKLDEKLGAGIKKYTSSDGFDILVGRSATANNRLTFHIAARTDSWLHAEGIKGAHVVIRLKGKADAPRKTLEEAAKLAAFYSDAKHASLVPVIYTTRRYVHAIKGKPGMVRLDRSKTIFVQPKGKI